MLLWLLSQRRGGVLLSGRLMLLWLLSKSTGVLLSGRLMLLWLLSKRAGVLLSGRLMLLWLLSKRAGVLLSGRLMLLWLWSKRGGVLLSGRLMLLWLWSKSAGVLLSSRLRSWLAKRTKSSRQLVLPVLGLLLRWLLMSCKHILGWLLSTELLLLSELPVLVLLRRLSERLLLLRRLSKCATKTRKGNSKSCRGLSSRSNRPHHTGLVLGQPKVGLLDRKELKFEHYHVAVGDHEVTRISKRVIERVFACK
jgi:hypothetical protein